MASDLRSRRRVARLSQQALADRAGCSIAMVRYLEAGMRPAKSEVLARIEAVLDNHGADAPTGAIAPTDPIGEAA